LALSRKALLPPRTSPDLGLLIVISGGGVVQIGDSRSAIHHGEAVELPPNVSHGAWTEASEMRAILVELPDRAIEASHQRVGDASGSVSQGQGRLAERTERPEDHDETEGEPW
jgi:quercetin dioxygenase-like cupin family protein